MKKLMFLLVLLLLAVPGLCLAASTPAPASQTQAVTAEVPAVPSVDSPGQNIPSLEPGSDPGLAVSAIEFRRRPRRRAPEMPIAGKWVAGFLALAGYLYIRRRQTAQCEG